MSHVQLNIYELLYNIICFLHHCVVFLNECMCLYLGLVLCICVTNPLLVGQNDPKQENLLLFINLKSINYIYKKIYIYYVIIIIGPL